MKLAICNEFCEGWDLARVFRLAADTGYQGVELAPFTLAPDIRDVDQARRRQVAADAGRAGVEIVGLHWLLVSPDGLHINHPDADVRLRTVEYLQALIDFCADVGGTKLVFGSPKQRDVLPELSFADAWELARDTFAAVLPRLESRGVVLCIEPLARDDTNFITTAAAGVRLCQELDHPRFRLHLDVKAMHDEQLSMAEIIRASADYLAHFHANDANRGYPGSGDTDFAPVAAALHEIGYTGYVSVEVFDFTPGATTIAEKSYEYPTEIFGG